MRIDISMSSLQRPGELPPNALCKDTGVQRPMESSQRPMELPRHPLSHTLLSRAGVQRPKRSLFLVRAFSAWRPQQMLVSPAELPCSSDGSPSSAQDNSAQGHIL